MGDLQRKIDKFLKLAYNILIKTASKGSQGSPSWQICLAREYPKVCVNLQTDVR